MTAPAKQASSAPENEARVVYHVHHKRDIEFSRQTGLETKALCGTWGVSAGGEVGASPHQRRGRDTCETCMRLWREMEW